MSYTLPSARYLIPADLKRSTIRRRNPVKEEQIERIKVLQHYWQHRSPDHELLGVRDLKNLKVIEKPILDFIWTAPPEVIYCEGFGNDPDIMELFFIDHYNEDVLGSESAFYMVEWHPKHAD